MSNEESQPETPTWYAGRTAYRRSRNVEGEPKVLFEERIVIVLAHTHKEAEEKVWAEAQEYASQSADQELLPSCAVYHTLETELCDRLEVWSVLRDEDSTPLAYEAKHYAIEMDSLAVEHTVHTDTKAALETRYSPPANRDSR